MKVPPAVVVLTSILVLAFPAHATERGVVFTDRSFSGAIPSGYSDSSDFAACEYRRGSSDGAHFQRIYGGRNDKCSPHTKGAPSGGDVSIFKRFDVNEGEWYKAWAEGEIYAPDNAIAVVKLLFRTPSRMVGECYGKIEETSPTIEHTGEARFAPRGFEKPERSDSGGCKVPNNVTEVSVAYRVHSKGRGASGRAILYQLRFGRCENDGDCSNVSAP